MGKRGPKPGTKYSSKPGPPKGTNVNKPVLEINDALIDNIKYLSRRGMNLDDIALLCGVSQEWFYARMVDSKQIKTAYEQGKAESKLYDFDKLRHHIDDGSLPALLFRLRARHKVRDNEPVQIVQQQSVQQLAVANAGVETQQLSEGELKKALALAAAELDDE